MLTLRRSLYPGPRTVLGKTCSKCGKFKPGSSFRHNRGQVLRSECKECSTPMTPKQIQAIARRQANHQMRSLTPLAVERRWQPWTDEELKIALDHTHTAREVTTLINRTYSAVVNMRRRHAEQEDS